MTEESVIPTRFFVAALLAMTTRWVNFIYPIVTQVGGKSYLLF